MLGAHVDICSAHHCLKFFALFGKRDGDDVSGAAGTCRAPGAVQIGLVVCRGIHVYDELHRIDVHATGGDVGGATRTRALPVVKAARLRSAGRLRKVAMQVDRRNSGFGELLGELAGLMLGTHEQHPPASARGETVHEFLLGLDPRDMEHVVRHSGHGVCRRSRPSALPGFGGIA